MADNVILITGDDEPTIETEARKLVREIAGDEPDAFALEIVREKENATISDLIHEVVRAVLSPPFLGGRKTVWLQNFHGFDREGSQKDTSPEASAFRKLAELIGKGIGDDMVLIMNGPDADQRKALCRACKAHGVLRIHRKPDIRQSRTWQGDMRQLVTKAAEDKGVALPRDVLGFLVDALGTDTARVDSELEKLICYCGGPDAPITLDAVEEVCLAEGETVSWAFTGAIGDRRPGQAIQHADTLLRQEKDPEGAVMGLLVQTQRHLRNLLEVKVFMHRSKIRAPGAVQDAIKALSDEDKAAFEREGLDIVTYNPYRVLKLAESAVRYGGTELVKGIIATRDAYRKCVSSTSSNRVVLENLVLRICGPQRGDTGWNAPRRA